MESAAPPPSRSRFLDVLRGVALLGILPANILYFGLPAMATADPLVWATTPRPDWLGAQATRFFHDYKFITLFSTLFGIGIVLMRQSAERRGTPFTPIMVRRLLALLAFGALHIALFWYGDILFYYAVFGLAVFWCSRFQARTLARVGIALVLVPTLFFATTATTLSLVESNSSVQEFKAEFERQSSEGDEATPEEHRARVHGSWNDYFEGLTTFNEHFEAEVYRHGSWLRMAILRVTTWLTVSMVMLLYFSWRIVGLFLLGMALAKSGWFLRPDQHRAAFKRLVTWGLIAGVPLQAAACALAAWPNDTWTRTLTAEGAQYTGSFFLSAAVAGLVGLLVREGRWPRWTRPLEAIGRTAFTNYALQTVLCTTLFYSYGAGWFGTLGRGALWGVVASVWLLQIAVSPLWLRGHSMGPLERIWRFLTYGSGPTRSAAKLVPPGG